MADICREEFKQRLKEKLAYKAGPTDEVPVEIEPIPYDALFSTVDKQHEDLKEWKA